VVFVFGVCLVDDLPAVCRDVFLAVAAGFFDVLVAGFFVWPKVSSEDEQVIATTRRTDEILIRDTDVIVAQVDS
jgi:hypothetical protein